MNKRKQLIASTRRTRAWLILATCLLLIVSASAQTIDHQAAKRAQAYEPYIVEVAARHKIDPRLLWTIAYLETRFEPRAVSPKGARGMMQFISSTARSYGLADPHNPWAAIDSAARYVRDLQLRFQAPQLVLAAYNAGDTAVTAYLSGNKVTLSNGKVINPQGIRTGGVPPYRETQAYVAEGMRLLAKLGAEETLGRYRRVQEEESEPLDQKQRSIRRSIYFPEKVTISLVALDDSPTMDLREETGGISTASRENLSGLHGLSFRSETIAVRSPAPATPAMIQRETDARRRRKPRSIYLGAMSNEPKN